MKLAPGKPATQGTLILNRNSVFGWNAGILENVTVNVTRTGTTVALANVPALLAGASRTMHGTAFSVAGILSWGGGDVSVTDPAANSSIDVGSTGEFKIGVPGEDWGGGTWGVVGTDPTSHFNVRNQGKVTLNASGTPQLKADYTNQGLTELQAGTLKITGTASSPTGSSGCSTTRP